MHKLGERLFSIYVGGDGFGKKKGMHWSTFNRLHDRYKTLEQMWYVSVEQRCPGFIDPQVTD